MNQASSLLTDKLKFHDAYLGVLQSKVVKPFEPKYESDLWALKLQTRAYIEQSDTTVFTDDEDGDYGLFTVTVAFGIRWFREPRNTEDLDICAIIECEYILEYVMREAIEQNTLDEFALSQVIMDAWPYWRELIMSQCGRMQLTGVKIPASHVLHGL
jgi:hypothetical protein